MNPRSPRAGIPWRATLCVLVLVVLAGCGQSMDPHGERASAGDKVRVLRLAAAADLKFAFADLAEGFAAIHPEIELSIAFGSSGNLFAQLSSGAPFDLYLSADASYPKKLIERKIAREGSFFLYAVGQLALWVRKDSRIDVGAGVAILKDPAVRKIAIANPAHAPYGRAAMAALEAAGVKDAVRGKLVLGENVAQALQFAESGAADVGLVALSLAAAPEANERGRHAIVVATLHPPIEQGGAILSGCKDLSAAESFRDFLTGDVGQGILARNGFLPPER